MVLVHCRSRCSRSQWLLGFDGKVSKRVCGALTGPKGSRAEMEALHPHFNVRMGCELGRGFMLIMVSLGVCGAPLSPSLLPQLPNVALDVQGWHEAHVLDFLMLLAHPYQRLLQS